jgi:septal ring factor EnvC (AmiA/AmiB activator)
MMTKEQVERELAVNNEQIDKLQEQAKKLQESLTQVAAAMNQRVGARIMLQTLLKEEEVAAPKLVENSDAPVA